MLRLKTITVLFCILISFTASAQSEVRHGKMQVTKETGTSSYDNITFEERNGRNVVKHTPKSYNTRSFFLTIDGIEMGEIGSSGQKLKKYFTSCPSAMKY